MSDDLDWLDITPDPVPTASAVRIEGGKKLPLEARRAKAMQKQMVGKSRVWATDGEFVWFRRKKSNPETLARHNRFIATGNYKHIYTSDDVEVYQLMPGSPFKRAESVNLLEFNAYDLRRHAARAACRHDWATFLDALEEIASRCKGQLEGEFERQVYGDNLNEVFNSIARRHGPSREIIDREVKALRARRGLDRGRVLLVPDTMH